MKNIMPRILNRSIALINRVINRRRLKRKVFCIGLHKTGTTSICVFSKKYGYKATHTVDWIHDSEQLLEFEFFTDGGSHFDNQNELDFKRLFHEYPNSLFILQTRDAKKWIISKLKHSGWSSKTIVQIDDESKIHHDGWNYKSFLTIENLIRHKYNYEHKVIDFFKRNDSHRLLIIDLVDKNTQEASTTKLVTFLGLRSISKISLPHKNKVNSEDGLTEEVSDFIDRTIAVCESKKMYKPKDLFL